MAFLVTPALAAAGVYRVLTAVTGREATRETPATVSGFPDHLDLLEFLDQRDKRESLGTFRTDRVQRVFQD